MDSLDPACHLGARADAEIGDARDVMTRLSHFFEFLRADVVAQTRRDHGGHEPTRKAVHEPLDAAVGVRLFHLF